MTNDAENFFPGDKVILTGPDQYRYETFVKLNERDELVVQAYPKGNTIQVAYMGTRPIQIAHKADHYAFPLVGQGVECHCGRGINHQETDTLWV